MALAWIHARETSGLGGQACRMRCEPGRETPIPDQLVGILPHA